MANDKQPTPGLAIRHLLFAEWLSDGRSVVHHGITEAVSAHGALLRVFSLTPPGETLILENPDSGQRVEARIVAMEASPESVSFIMRVEFLQPAFEFWKTSVYAGAI